MAARIIAVFFFVLSMTGNGVLAQSPLPVESLERAQELIRLALVDRTGYTIVESLTTEVGPRLAGSEAEQMLRLAESLEDLDDVQNFYANFDISEEELESLSKRL